MNEKLKHDRARNKIWYRLIGLAGEGDLLAVSHALLDDDFEELLLGDDLVAVARRASVLVGDGLSGALALVAGVLHLLDHGRAQLPHRHLHPRPLAAPAARRRPRLRPLPEISPFNISLCHERFQ